MVHQVTRNKRAGRKSCKEMCDYLGFIYLDPICQEDGRDGQLQMTLENKRVARTMLKGVFEQAEANTPAAWVPVVTIRPHNTGPQDAFCVLRGSDLKNILEQLREKGERL